MEEGSPVVVNHSELDDELKDLLFFPLSDGSQFGPWSRRMRGFTSTSSEDVAEVMGTTRSRVCAIERGSYMPKVNTMISLAGAHGCRIWVVRNGIDFS